MWRKIYLALVLIIFGVALIPLGFILLWICAPFDRKGTINFAYSRLWGFLLIHLNPFWHVDVEGLENIDPSKTYVIISNHQSMFDIPLFYYIPNNFRWVSKREVLKVPIIGWVLWMQHGITIKRGTVDSAKRMIVDGQRLISKGVSIAVFPEGTRTKTGAMGKFLPGAFLLASRCNVPILPIVLDGSYQLMTGHHFNHKLKVKILPPVSEQEIASMKLSALSEKMNELIRQEHIKLAPQFYNIDGKSTAE